MMHLLIVVKAVSLAHLRNTESTVSSISFLCQRIGPIFGNILAAIRPIDVLLFYFCVLLSF